MCFLEYFCIFHYVLQQHKFTFYLVHAVVHISAVPQTRNACGSRQKMATFTLQHSPRFLHRTVVNDHLSWMCACNSCLFRWKIFGDDGVTVVVLLEGGLLKESNKIRISNNIYIMYTDVYIPFGDR